MKKGLFCLLCIMLAMAYAMAGTAAVTYTLPEKMEKQLAIGSGLKGSFLLSAEGNDPLVLSMEPFVNVPLQMRGMKSEQDAHYYIYQAEDDEKQKGLTELLIREDQLYFRSDLLPDRVFSLPQIAELADLLTAGEGGNPSSASMLIRYFGMTGEEKAANWVPFVEKLEQKIEVWISGYMVGNSLRPQKDGSSVVRQNYTIPMSELKKEIIRLLDDIRSDPDSLALLESLMNPEQKKIYLNKYLDYFYQEAMDALQDDFDVVLSRTVTTMGNEISSSIELPLDPARFGYSSLLISSGEGTLSCMLKNDRKTLYLVTEDDPNFREFNGLTFWMMSYPEADEETETERRAVRVELGKSTETSTDEESRDHQTDHWTLRVEDDLTRLPESEQEHAVNYQFTPPVTADLTLHYYSKYSQSSPTTLEIKGVFEKENLKIGLEGTWKTASPWIFSPFDISSAENFLDLSAEQQMVCLAEWLASASEQLEKQTEEAQPETAAETPAATEPKETGESETEASANADENAAAEQEEAGEPETEAPADADENVDSDAGPDGNAGQEDTGESDESEPAEDPEAGGAAA